MHDYCSFFAIEDKSRTVNTRTENFVKFMKLKLTFTLNNVICYAGCQFFFSISNKRESMNIMPCFIILAVRQHIEEFCTHAKRSKQQVQWIICIFFFSLFIGNFLNRKWWKIRNINEFKRKKWKKKQIIVQIRRFNCDTNKSIQTTIIFSIFYVSFSMSACSANII